MGCYILLALEIIHHMKCKIQGKKGGSSFENWH